MSGNPTNRSWPANPLIRTALDYQNWATKPAPRFCLSRCLHFVCRLLTCNTLPLPARHFHPGVGKPFINVKWIARGIGSLQSLETGHDGRIPEGSNLYITVFGATVFGRFCTYQHLSLPNYFAVALRGDKFIRNSGSDQIRIVLFLRPQPPFFESRDGLLRFVLLWSLRPRDIRK